MTDAPIFRQYINRNFTDESMQVIIRARQICQDYADQGYDLTLRQLYYQFVSRNWLPNTDRSYDRLGSIVNDARLAGLIAWNHLVDRTRNLTMLAQWEDPADIVDAVARQYRIKMWANQPWYVEAWVEKEALAGVVKRPSDRLYVPFFSCRGYVSQSEMWAAAQRFIEAEDEGKQTLIIHLGDHDPSGLDMTRDIRDRMELFGSTVTVNRIALNMDQVQQYQPPPNPAKLSDARAAGYIAEYGYQSWELDALDPATLDALITDAINAVRDEYQWDLDWARQENDRTALTSASENWTEVVEHMINQEWMDA